MDSSDESDLDDDLDQPAAVKTKHHDLMMKNEGSRKGSFFKQAKKAYPMFPVHEERIKWDEYGEIIRYGSFSARDRQPAGSLGMECQKCKSCFCTSEARHLTKRDLLLLLQFKIVTKYKTD